MSRLIHLLIALLFCCIPHFVFAEETSTEMQEMDLDGKKLYFWSPLTERKAPLVIFTHAFTGCATDFKYLARALAEDGFWVAAINHKDSVCITKRAAKGPDVPFDQPDKWDDKTYADRKDDINALLESMVKNELFLKHVDFEHVGLAGHSLGGYVAMGMAGAWDSWKTKDIKAVLALAPHHTPFVAKNTIGNINVPIMYQCGTRDTLITPSIKKTDGVYAKTPPDKYLMILDGATHLAWTDHVTQFHPSIISYAVAFFDYYLRGNASAGKLLIDKRNDVAALYYDNRMGKVELPKEKPAAPASEKPKKHHRH